MAEKRFLDGAGVGHLWEKIKAAFLKRDELDAELAAYLTEDDLSDVIYLTTENWPDISLSVTGNNGSISSYSPTVLDVDFPISEFPIGGALKTCNISINYSLERGSHNIGTMNIRYYQINLNSPKTGTWVIYDKSLSKRYSFLGTNDSSILYSEKYEAKYSANGDNATGTIDLTFYIARIA